MKLGLAVLTLPAIAAMVVVCPPIGLVATVAFLTYLTWKHP